jgi:hypothetical protein
MLTYDPSADVMSTPIDSMSIEEELARQPQSDKKGVPTGLLNLGAEKKIDESQMADFSSSIEEVLPGPGQLIQDEVQGSAYAMRPGPPPQKQAAGQSGSKNPFGLTDDQYFAALAGVAAVIAFSKPVQGKLSTMVPKFLGENGSQSMTGLAVTALIAGLIFYFARKFLTEK